MTANEAVEVLNRPKNLVYPDSLEGTMRAERDHEAIDMGIQAILELEIIATEMNN